jgi:hypothetical protein
MYYNEGWYPGKLIEVLLSRIRERLEALGFRRPILSLLRTRPLVQQPSAPAGLQNVEVITWTDWRGRERKIIIHREVHS